MKKYNTLILIIIAVLVMGAGCAKQEEKVVEDVVVEQHPEDQVDSPSGGEENGPSPAKAMADIVSDEMKAIMDEVSYAYSGELKDVTEQKIIRGITTDNSSGRVQADYINDKYMLMAEFDNLPQPQGGDFYEGWVVRKQPFHFVTTGRVNVENGRDVNKFVSDNNLLDYTLYVLTLEPDDGDPVPAEHILEGELEM